MTRRNQWMNLSSHSYLCHSKKNNREPSCLSTNQKHLIYESVYKTLIYPSLNTLNCSTASGSWPCKIILACTKLLSFYQYIQYFIVQFNKVVTSRLIRHNAIWHWSCFWLRCWPSTALHAHFLSDYFFWSCVKVKVTQLTEIVQTIEART